jgi:CheY-like chemotaxis protein
MAKIMLVEDDNNLREIYEARLVAEGYDIVSAKDGEEALALAVKEKPDLIISDVMMPKISGFDMLDILRSTPETKDTKVIMMTALSQAEDKGRADKLGADRYLVKSQVTLEDVARVAQDVLSDAAVPTTAPVTPQSNDVPMTPAADPAPSVQSGIPPVEPLQPTVAPITSVPVAEPLVPAPQAPIAAPVAEEPAIVSPVVQDTAIPTETVSAPPTTSPDPIVTPVTPIEEPASAPAPVTESAEPHTTQQPTTTSETAAPMAPSAVPEAPTMSTGISEDLTQTTKDEEIAVESQINQILADSYDPADEQAAEVAPMPQVVSPSEPAAPSIPVSINIQTPEESDVAPEPVAEPATAPAPDTNMLSDNTDSAVTGAKKVIQPLNDLNAKPNLDELLKMEEAAPAPSDPVTPVADEVVAPAPELSQNKPPEPGGVSPNDIAL